MDVHGALLRWVQYTTLSIHFELDDFLRFLNQHGPTGRGSTKKTGTSMAKKRPICTIHLKKNMF